MAKAKGADILFIKKHLQTTHGNLESQFMQQLNLDEQQLYKTIVAVSWIPTEINAKFQKYAAALLYPNDPRGLQKLGYEQAKSDLGGIYRILLKIVTIPALLKQISKLWKTYNDQGTMEATMTSPKSGIITISDFPDYPRNSLSHIEGYILGCLEMTGAKNVTIKSDYSKPDQWSFSVKWST